MAMTMGGNCRAGFEDNPYYRPGEPATRNAQLIERLVRIARELGREPATPAEARQLLGLLKIEDSDSYREEHKVTMITRSECNRARQRAAEILKNTGLALRQEEIEGMEVADFGLSELEQSGAQILTLVNTG